MTCGRRLLPLSARPVWRVKHRERNVIVMPPVRRLLAMSRTSLEPPSSGLNHGHQPRELSAAQLLVLSRIERSTHGRREGSSLRTGRMKKLNAVRRSARVRVRCSTGKSQPRDVSSRSSGSHWPASLVALLLVSWLITCSQCTRSRQLLDSSYPRPAGSERDWRRRRAFCYLRLLLFCHHHDLCTTTHLLPPPLSPPLSTPPLSPFPIARSAVVALVTR